MGGFYLDCHLRLTRFLAEHVSTVIDPPALSGRKARPLPGENRLGNFGKLQAMCEAGVLILGKLGKLGLTRSCHLRDTFLSVKMGSLGAKMGKIGWLAASWALER